MAKVSRLTLSQYKQNSRAVYKAYTTRLYEYQKGGNRLLIHQRGLGKAGLYLCLFCIG